MKRFSLLYIAPCLALWVWLLLPLIRGSETLVLRDVLNLHYPMKVTQAQAMRQGYLPVVDPYRAGGQPHLGNPNSAPLYPDNLLFLLAPPLWVLNAHFWIHFLLAPFSFFWLARAWGLSPPASWISGLCYGLSGYFFSQLNLYNLVAGAALTPALVAACLGAQRLRAPLDPERPAAESPPGPDGTKSTPWLLVAVALLWALLLLSGDPMMALQALLLAAAALLLRPGGGLRGSLPVAAAVGCGTLLATPQIVELLRILGLSYRGYWGFSPEFSLLASFHPGTVFEWLVPTFFGRPELGFWGQRFFAGHLPLFFSLYPGLLALVLVLSSGQPRGGRAWWAWGSVAVGLFLALGGWNPLVRLLMGLPGAGLLRFPIKLWLLVAVGGALLCGLGFQATLEQGRRRRLTLAVAGLTGVYGALWAGLSFLPQPAESLMRRWIPPAFPSAYVSAERVRWAGICLLSLLVLVLFALAVRLGRRNAELAGATLAWIHVGAQLLFLRTLLPTDEARQYREPPSLLASVGPEERVVHGGYKDLFGKVGAEVRFPDRRLMWVQRRGWNELYPFAGSQWGRRYDLNISPEGLDSFLTFSTFQAVELLSDSERLRVLAALGVDVLLLDRQLAAETAPQVRLRHRHPSFGEWVYVYEVLGSADEVQLVGQVRRAAHMNDALARITDPGFDPRTMVVLPGAPEPEGDDSHSAAAPGKVKVLAVSPESLRVQVDSTSPGVLVVQRTYLPLYRATIDGEPAPIRVANLSRLGLEVPAGSHEIRLWVDRRPLWLSLAGIPLGLLGLWWLWRRQGAGSKRVARLTAVS